MDKINDDKSLTRAGARANQKVALLSRVCESSFGLEIQLRFTFFLGYLSKGLVASIFNKNHIYIVLRVLISLLTRKLFRTNIFHFSWNSYRQKKFFFLRLGPVFDKFI